MQMYGSSGNGFGMGRDGIGSAVVVVNTGGWKPRHSSSFSERSSCWICDEDFDEPYMGLLQFTLHGQSHWFVA